MKPVTLTLSAFGPYREEERDLTLQYRGSANQRLIEHPGKLI